MIIHYRPNFASNKVKNICNSSQNRVDMLCTQCYNKIVPKQGRKEVKPMIDKKKLLGKMIYAGYDQTQFSKLIGMSKNSFSSKINGKGYFDTKQILQMCKLLDIDTDKEKVDIFLRDASQNKDDSDEKSA